MTDRDLFYCGDFDCDGHARSNEHCDTVFGGDPDEPVKPALPKYTVSGNAISITRLDADGNPTGEPINLSGAFSQVAFGLPSDLEIDDFRVDWPTETVSMDIELGSVDPAILALLTGQGEPLETIEIFDSRTRWQRFVDRVRYYWTREWVW